MNKNIDINLPEFKILIPQDMKRVGNFKTFNPKNSMYDEIVYRLESDNYLSFEGYEGYQIIGIHGWILEVNGEITKLPFGTALTNCGAIYIGDKNVAVVKKIAKINHYCEVLKTYYLVKGRTEQNLMVNYVTASGGRYAGNPRYEVELRTAYNRIKRITSIHSLQEEYNKF